MSADNGIYIGRFPVQGYEHLANTDMAIYEYRVIHAQAIENLEFFSEEQAELEKKFNGENPRAIVEYFGDAYPFSDGTRAREKAFQMEQEILNDAYCPILEYGINSMSFRKPMSFYREHAKEIVYKWDKQPT